MGRIARRAALGVMAACGAALLAELGARGWLHWIADETDFRRYASIGDLRARYGGFERFQAHRHLGYALVPGYENGPNRHNRLGFRGAELEVHKRAGSVRIACCGGSTTYGEGVADWRLAFPALLEEELKKGGRDVEVVNAGCPGWTTLETLVNFETRLLDLGPDWIVADQGINDVLPRMVWPPEACHGDLSGWLTRTEHLTEASLIERSALLRILLVKHGSIEPHSSMMRIIGDVAPTCCTWEFRAQRNGGRYPSGIFAEVPVERMLAANGPVFFERNLRSLLAAAAAHGVRVLLTTFPFSREFPDQAYIGHPAVQAAIEGTNAIVLRLARETGTPVLDLVPGFQERSLFTDGVHSTEAGNRKRAALLQLFFKDRLP